MILLYPEKTTSFNNNGLGALSDAISCVVEWERNGVYELAMVYPVTGIHYSEIQYGRIILAKPTPQKQAQPFVIYKIEAPIDGRVTINAQHISYNLNGIPVEPFEANSASAAIAGIKTHSLITNPFTFTTDVTTHSTFNPSVPDSARHFLGGVEGSILDQFGGEYEFDRLNVILHAQMGSDDGATLRYGKNITDINQETNIESTVTGVMPYFANDTTKVYGDVIYATNHASFPIENIEVVDVSGDFDENSDPPTKAQVNAAGARNLNGRSYIGVPSVSIKVSFVNIWDSEEYKALGRIENVEPCDIVTVIFEKLGVNAKSKVIRTTYNVLSGRYDSIEIGDLKQTFAKAMAQETKTVEKVTEVVEENQRSTNVRMEALDNAIELEVTDRTNADEDLSGRINVQAGEIAMKVNAGDISAEINLTPQSALIDASKIDLVGYATFYDLSTGGMTTINGDNITTGTIAAERLDLSTEDSGILTKLASGSIEFYYNNALRSYISSGNNDSMTIGTTSNYTNRTIYVNAKKMYGTSNCRLVFPGGVWTNDTTPLPTNMLTKSDSNGTGYGIDFYGITDGDARGATISYVKYRTETSDIRLKTNISEMSDIYEKYMMLCPKTYQFEPSITEDNDKFQTRYGLIAQDVMGVDPDLVTMTTTSPGSSHAALCGEYELGLNYNDLHAWHIQMIQRQQAKIEELEERLIQLEGGIS